MQKTNCKSERALTGLNNPSSPTTHLKENIKFSYYSDIRVMKHLQDMVMYWKEIAVFFC